MTEELIHNSPSTDPQGEAARSLDEIIQKNGYGDGRLFSSASRATYTLIHHNEVISIHFDRERQNLYWQGHKIRSFEDHDQLEELLLVFKHKLLDKKATRELLSAFDATISRLSQNQ